MSTALSTWVELLVALLLVLSGLLTLVGAVGLWRLPDFFQRMHPPALGFTLGTWSASLASIVYFSALETRLALHSWLIIILLAVTVPVTTTLLARAALFRQRVATSADSVKPAPPRGPDQGEA